MRVSSRYRWSMIVAAAAIAFCALFSATAGARSQNVPKPRTDDVMPRYDANRALLLPADYRRWVLAGTSLGISYSEGAPADPMFHETLIEPSAYRHFVETGQFREGTMLVLMLHGVGQGALPSRHGQYATEVHGVEMAVKDSSRTPEGWAYYAFNAKDGTTAASAQPMPKASCYTCHSEHAARDNVFMQYYALLSAAAPTPRR